MNDTITHSGLVESIEGEHIRVRILQVSGCASCKIAGHCNASESKEKLIDVYHADASRYHVGDAVVVSTDLGTGYRAVALGFGLPLVLLIAVIVVGIKLTGNEGMSALLGIAALIPYYIGLYLVRDKLRKRFSFELK